MNKCLYCYQEIEDERDFHQKCALNFFGNNTSSIIPYTYDQMSSLAKDVVDRSISVPGVQPKLSLSLINDEINISQSRMTVVGALVGDYILKPPTEHYPEMPANEHVTMRIAEAFGIKVVPSSLIKLQSGELSYITKRIDRTTNGDKIHMLDMYQITEAFDKYKSSLEKIGKAIDSYSDNTLLDKILFFEIVLFSYVVGNNDMHLKNFSMIHSSLGWQLAPAYDLLNVHIANPDDKEESALTIEGKKKKLKLTHFENLAKGMGLSDRQISGAINRLAQNKSKAIKWVMSSFLTETMKKSYIDVLEQKYKNIGLG